MGRLSGMEHLLRLRRFLHFCCSPSSVDDAQRMSSQSHLSHPLFRADNPGSLFGFKRGNVMTIEAEGDGETRSRS